MIAIFKYYNKVNKKLKGDEIDEKIYKCDVINFIIRYEF